MSLRIVQLSTSALAMAIVTAIAGCKTSEEQARHEPRHRTSQAEMEQVFAYTGDERRLTGNIVTIELEADRAILLSEGEHLVVSLSQIGDSRLQELNLQPNNPVTVTGAFQEQEIDGRRVFLATDLKKGTPESESAR